MHIFSHSHSGASHRIHDTLKHRMSENPYLHWFLILVMTLILSLSFCAIGFYKYTDATRRLAETPTITTASTRLFDASELSALLKQFDDRAEQRTIFMKGYAGVSDPTL